MSTGEETNQFKSSWEHASELLLHAQLKTGCVVRIFMEHDDADDDEWLEETEGYITDVGKSDSEEWFEIQIVKRWRARELNIAFSQDSLASIEDVLFYIEAGEDVQRLTGDYEDLPFADTPQRFVLNQLGINPVITLVTIPTET